MAENKKKILFIEDDPPTLDVYGTALREAGFWVEIVTLGEEAIRKLRKVTTGGEEPDLILLDIVLPDMNGLDILREIRRQKETKDIPVFIITNYTDKQSKKTSAALGSERYLLKTKYPPQQLVKVVESRLGK